jgi:hypothetical protein
MPITGGRRSVAAVIEETQGAFDVKPAFVAPWVSSMTADQQYGQLTHL